jgi:hypothetical protein
MAGKPSIAHGIRLGEFAVECPRADFLGPGF